MERYLRETMSEIVKTEDVLGGEPRLQGRRISVIQIADMLIKGEQSPVYVADQLNISLAEVHAAMAYYYENPDEMDEIRARHRELETALRSESSAQETVEQ